MSDLPFLVAWQIGLVPFAWLLWRAVGNDAHDAAWWWLAGAFFVSWLADAAAYTAVDPWLVSAVYPVSQAAIVGLVFLTRKDAMRLLAVLLAVGIISVLWRGVSGPDVFLRTVAWGAVAGIVVDRWELGRLRTALLVAFGLGLVSWWCYALWPGYPTWIGYQLVRAFGVVLFCLAAVRPVSLALARPAGSP